MAMVRADMVMLDACSKCGKKEDVLVKYSRGQLCSACDKDLQTALGHAASMWWRATLSAGRVSNED